ncbi:MAG TPA: gamma-glutamylcyclotransferase family protein [Opitutaceae bacterium]|nr:gamma-glutamylcyclotransferase family protein [Opitutaceae bacterium]
MNYIFVYGTLKRGYMNNFILAAQEYYGPAVTKPGFVLYELEGYPGMVEDPSALEGIVGEVWSVDDKCLRHLDKLEGLKEGLYRRAAVPLEAPFEEKKVQAYLYLRDVSGRARAPRDWKA